MELSYVYWACWIFPGADRFLKEGRGGSDQILSRAGAFEQAVFQDRGRGNRAGFGIQVANR